MWWTHMKKKSLLTCQDFERGERERIEMTYLPFCFGLCKYVIGGKNVFKKNSTFFPPLRPFYFFFNPNNVKIYLFSTHYLFSPISLHTTSFLIQTKVKGAFGRAYIKLI